MSSQAIKMYFLLLVLVFAVFVIVRVRGVINLDKSVYTVLSQTKLTDTDYALNLEPKYENHIRPKRGQYIYLKLGYISEDHPFSVLQYDPTTNNLRVGYRVFGEYTNIMSSLSAGDTVYIGGPYGTFMSQYPDESKPVVFLSGGIGITPFVDQIIHNHDSKEQWLFAANRSKTSAVFTPELAPYLGSRVVRVYSQETTQLQTGEESGHITAEMLKKYLGDLNRYSFYLCGPPAMMDAMRAMLVLNNVPKAVIHNETFGW